MLRALSSGVSGLQAHQVAMDVESNNIANVDTTGFKYSRADFSSLLSQVSQLPTGPQNSTGGTNGTAVGLGTSISSTTRIDSQGAIESTDKNTDCAIQGNGFFIVSADNGITDSYSRSGNFNFDQQGNFVDNNGYKVMGWTRNTTTGIIDPTPAGLSPIVISPGLTTPAQPTTYLSVNANLDSGSTINVYSPISSLDSIAGGTILSGDTTVTTNNEDTSSAIYTDSKGNLIERGQDMGVMTDSSGNGLQLQNDQGESISFRSATVPLAGATPTNVAAGATSLSSGDLTINGIDITGTISSDATTAASNAASLAQMINAQTSQTGVTATVVLSTDGTLDGIKLVNDNSGTVKNVNVTTSATGTTNSGVSTAADDPATQFRYTDGTTNPLGQDANTGIYYFHTSEDLRSQMQTVARATASPTATVTVDSTGKFQISNPANGVNSAGVAVTGTDMNINVTSISDSNTLPNSVFNTTISTLSGALAAGTASSNSSQAFNIPTLSTSIDVFDSLGSKHTVTMNFTKSSNSTWDCIISVPQPGILNPNGGSSGKPANMIEGTIKFNSDGSFSNSSITQLSFTANNGSVPDQKINFELGTANAFDGITSFDSASATGSVNQDGFTGGVLTGISIDQSGTLIGAFSNGKSFGLAQLGMATFANDAGLSTTGGNLFQQSSNSGNPSIGTASTGGRGAIQSSALEDSNVDLSRALTQLIVIQRGYQANAKTITTADQILQTLISIKQ